jgi:hypothetical protein
MISSKQKSNGKTPKAVVTPKSAPAPKQSAPVFTESRISGRKATQQTPRCKSVDWINVHFNERRGYKRVHVGHKYNPNEHAALCQRLREGKLGSGYFMQIEDPTAPALSR